MGKGSIFKVGTIGKGSTKANALLDELNETCQTGTAFLGINCTGGTGHLMKNKGKKKKRRK